jgi:hypothetical protein
MNKIDLFALTYCFAHLAKVMQENQSGGLIAVTLMACTVAIWKSSGR